MIRIRAIVALAAATTMLGSPALAHSNGMAGAQTVAATMASDMDMHGLPPGGDGPPYIGAPDLDATVALITAGGGAANFSIAKALTAMVGPDLTTAEVNKLTTQYGKTAVTNWITVFDFAVQHAAATAIAAGVTLPTPPASLTGKTLAAQLVKDGAGDGTFWTGTMLDHLVTHKIHENTMAAIDAKYTSAWDGNYHQITDQAMYDLAQALGATSVKLADFH
jgi:hypothetical protein